MSKSLQLAPAVADAFDELLTEQQISKLTKIPASTLRSWRKRGRGPRYLRLGDRVVRFRRRDINEWLASREVGGAR